MPGQGKYDLDEASISSTFDEDLWLLAKHADGQLAGCIRCHPLDKSSGLWEIGCLAKDHAADANTSFKLVLGMINLVRDDFGARELVSYTHNEHVPMLKMLAKLSFEYSGTDANDSDYGQYRLKL